MCRTSFMIDIDIIQCLLDDLLDRICSNNNSSSLNISPVYYSSQFIENKFNQSINLLNNSLKQLLTYELNTVVHNGQLNTTANIRHSRYYNPATTMKQSNDFKRRLQWIQQRQILVKQLNLNQEKKTQEMNYDLNSMENLWLNQRLQMLDNSIQLIKKDPIEDESNESSCARCRVYRPKPSTRETPLFKKIKQFYQVHNEHNYSRTHLSYPTPESDLIVSLSKIADRIGHSSNSTAPNSSKKVLKKKAPPPPPPKFQASLSLIVGDSHKPHKRTIEESRSLSNSNFMSNNFDLTNKRQKRIASPQSTLSISSTSGTTPGPISSSSPHEILTPTWRVLTNQDLENTDQQENEDIIDESYIRRHIRCELEQEPWITNPGLSNNIPISSHRKSGTLQTSLSVPNGLSTSTNPKQYRYRLTPNGIAYTETIDTK